MFPFVPRFNPVLDDDAPQDSFSKWGWGVVSPALIAAVGVSNIVWQRATLFGRRGLSMPLTGYDAVALGVVFLSVAALMHAHYFWSASQRWWAHAEVVKVVSLIAGLLGIGFVIVRNFSLI
jgi:hypothetical protein